MQRADKTASIRKELCKVSLSGTIKRSATVIGQYKSWLFVQVNVAYNTTSTTGNSPEGEDEACFPIQDTSNPLCNTAAGSSAMHYLSRGASE